MEIKTKIWLLILVGLLSSCQSITRFSNSNETSGMKNVYSKSKTDNTLSHNYQTNKEDSDNLTINSKQRLLLKEIEKWMGTPYQWGGTTQAGADCSGFVGSVFQSININLPRTAEQMYNYTPRIEISDLTVGDLIFFRKGNHVNHVAIYIGGNEIAHSSVSIGVSKANFSEYINYHDIAGCGRVLNN